jgi:hypothetical protein
MQKLKETESQVSKAQNKVKKSEDVSLCGIDAHEVLKLLLRPSILSKRMFNAKFAWSCYSNHMRESAFPRIKESLIIPLDCHLVVTSFVFHVCRSGSRKHPPATMKCTTTTILIIYFSERRPVHAVVVTSVIGPFPFSSSNPLHPHC